MRIAMIGTRGVPARYGGFETAIEEVGSRLAARGHEVIVFCRGAEERLPSYRGMTLVHLGAMKRRTLETLSHTTASVLHSSLKGVDAALLFNAANAPLLPILRARKVPVATHVDGLEWKRAKWGPLGKRYYRTAEALAVRWSDALIADADAIAAYYEHQFAVPSRVIAYGAPDLAGTGSSRLEEQGLESRGYHLVVARFEPENHVLEIVREYVRSAATKPLIVVGSAPYADEYTEAVRQAADDRVKLLGGVWDQDLLNELYANCLTYLHGHSVGGTNPSLLRAAGAGAPTLAYDCVFNREVIGEAGRFFRAVGSLAELIGEAERDPDTFVEMGASLHEASRRYSWDEVAVQYEALCEDLVASRVQAPRASVRRSRFAWDDTAPSSGAVLLAHPSPDLYGSDRVLLETTSAFVRAGVRVVVALPSEGPLIPLLRERGAEVRIVETPVLRKRSLNPRGLLDLVGQGLKFLRPARALIHEVAPSMVLVNTVTIPGWLMAAKISRVRTVCHVHEAERSQSRAIRRLLYAPLLLADQLVVNSKFSQAAYSSVWPGLSRRSELVYNGVPGPAVEPAAPRQNPNPIRLLFMGRLSERKGADVAVAAAAELKNRGHSVELGMLGAVFPGYEWFEDRLRDLVKTEGLGEGVEFYGFEPSIWGRLEDADIVLVPSVVDEPFGNTAVEAILAERPLIVSATSGLLEASAGFKAVRAVEPGSSPAIADAVESMIASWEQVRELVAQDRLNAEGRYSPDNYQRKIVAVLANSYRRKSNP